MFTVFIKLDWLHTQSSSYIQNIIFLCFVTEQEIGVVQ